MRFHSWAMCHGPVPSRGRQRPAGTGLTPTPAVHACEPIALITFLCFLPDEHRKPLCHSFTQGLHWYLINSIKQAP